MRKYWSVFSKLTWKQVRGEIRKPIGKVLVSLLSLILSSLWLGRVIAITSGRPFWLTKRVTILLSTREQWLIVILAIIIAILTWARLVLSAKALYKSALKAIELEKAVPFDFGQTLTEVMKKIRREPLEYLALCNKDGKVLYTGTIHSSNTTMLNDDDFEAVRKTGGLIMLHNHPSDGTAFSPNDLAGVFSYRLSKSVLIAKDTVFELEAPENLDEFDPAGIKNFAEQQKSHIMRMMSMAGCAIYTKEDGLSYYKHAKDWRLASILVCESVARYFGMKFTATPYRKSKYYQEWQPLVLVKLLIAGMCSLSTRRVKI